MNSLLRIDAIVNRDVLAGHSFVRRRLPLIVTSLIGLAIIVVFAVVPGEEIMGPVQRVFYFHVGSAISTYAMITLLLLGSIRYLATRSEEWDFIAYAACSVAFLFSTIVLATGMIWGHSAWNTWWRWEPRLVSFLVLWLILLAYLVFRRQATGSPGQRSLCAVLGIVSAVNVPIVVFSVKLLTTAEQLHPQVLGQRGLADPWYGYGLGLASVALVSLSLWLFTVQLAETVLRRDVELVGAQLSRHRRSFRVV